MSIKPLTPSEAESMSQQIFDHEGRSYDLSISQEGVLLLIQVCDRQILIGEAKCARESPDTLLLRDIAIANEVILPPAHPQATPRPRRSRPRPINYRQKGIGSALLSFLINQARADGVKHLYGKVMQQDLENNPKLLQWYQNHGFRPQDPAPDDECDILAWVHLALA